MSKIIKRNFNGQKIIEKSPQEIEELENKTPWAYCEIIIPGHIKSIPSIDRVNTVYKNGSETELFGLDENGARIKPYTIEEFQNKYSILKSDGKLYWIE